MSKNFDGFVKSNKDSDIEEQISSHCEEFGLSPLDAVKHFPVLVRRQLLKRFLAHVELFKLSIDVPGDIAELGVFRGFDLFTWANLLEAFCIGDRTKIVYGFDNWSGFVDLSVKDGNPLQSHQKTKGGYNPSSFQDQVKSAVKIFDNDRFIPEKPRVRFVDGDISLTVPEFIEENPGIRFSLVNFDCDMYEPTKAALESIWPKVSKGGVVIFDEYSLKEWPGETQAVDEYFGASGIRLKKFSWTNAPAAYVVKE